MRKETGFELQEFSPGGGFAVITRRSRSADSGRIRRDRRHEHPRRHRAHKLGEPRVFIEPGRALVARSGPLYAVGSTKDVRRAAVRVGGLRNGGQHPAGAVRIEVLSDHREQAAGHTSRDRDDRGQYCESGDVLLRDAELPPLERDISGDAGGGAYNLSMASNYNASQRPAIVLVADGRRN